MPLKPRYEKVKQAMIEKYGNDKGEKMFWAWVNEHNVKPDVGSDEKSVSIEGKSLVFSTDWMQHNVIDSKGDKKYYVTGYISTGEKDRVGDIVTPECLDDMVNQLKSNVIKVDVEHEALKNSPNIIPIGKIEEVKRDEKGVWVKVLLNSALDRFKEVWKSIQDGFLDHFSITYKPKKAIDRQSAAGKERLLQLVEIVNVAMTGIPANLGAKMTESFAKSLESIKEPTMAEKMEKKEDAQPDIKDVQVVEGKDIESAIKGVKDMDVAVKSLVEKVGKLEGVDMKSLIDGAIAKSLEPFTKRLEVIEAKMAEPVQKARAGETKEDIEAKSKAQEQFSILSHIK